MGVSNFWGVHLQASHIVVRKYLKSECCLRKDNTKCVMGNVCFDLLICLSFIHLHMIRVKR